MGIYKIPRRLDIVSESQPNPDHQLPSEEHRLPVEVPNVQVQNPLKKHLRYWDVYVDDFIGPTQGNKWRWAMVPRQKSAIHGVG